ncbi:MAG TPA: PmoA family protein [Verrucomicrobiae bacterium]|nr:PmoA family protein [Verrucomicrobiae bacterium]
MIHRMCGAAALLVFSVSAPLFAETGPLAFSVDEKTHSYTITEQGQPVLTYRFGEVPLPAGIEAGHFRKGDTPYDGAYFTDGSRYGGERSDYIYPLYGFHGESLTADYPKDHLHHRSLWWSWCEVRQNGKIGDLWAVCKIRAYPIEISKMEAGADQAVLRAVNVWRYDDDPAAVVKETATIRVWKAQGAPGARSRTIDLDIRLEALVDGMAITGRQKVDYGGYGGMTVRMNPQVKEFSIRAVHPNPDKWRGDDLAIVKRVIDPAAFGDAAWMALYGRYPAAGIESPDFTTVMMFESKTTPQYPNNFRYYGSTCISLAFPAKTVVPLPKGKPLDYKTRFVICEGKTTVERENALWQEYQR